MSEKAKRKNEAASQPDLGLWFIFLLLLFVLTIGFGQWIVFEQAMGIVLWAITTIVGIAAANTLRKQYRGVVVVMGVLLPFLLCVMVFVFILFAPTKECHLESLTVAYCDDHQERFGNGVPEPPFCWWRQSHIGGLILIRDKWDFDCYRGG